MAWPCVSAYILPLGKSWTVGRLLQEIEKTGVYIDPGIKNIWNVINQQRIIGVHVKERVPIPSKHQAYMVCHAVLDMLDRIAKKEY